MRVPESPVVTFQADGDELDAILRAFEAAGIIVKYPADRLTPIF